MEEKNHSICYYRFWHYASNTLLMNDDNFGENFPFLNIIRL